MYVAVSGNLGSGKTTIVRALASAFNCQLYPRSAYNTSYIEDLYREPKRWSTEAQISFLMHKYNAIREGMERGSLFILDRTFGEEVHVFAERFHDDGTIDDRGMELIRRLATDLEARLERPSLIVYCDCPVVTCEQRLAARPRGYQASYPPDHLRKLDTRLRAWLAEQDSVMVLHTDQIDYREPAVMQALA